MINKIINSIVEKVIKFELEVLKFVNILFCIVKNDLGFIINWIKFVIFLKNVFKRILISKIK